MDFGGGASVSLPLFLRNVEGDPECFLVLPFVCFKTVQFKLKFLFLTQKHLELHEAWLDKQKRDRRMAEDGQWQAKKTITLFVRITLA